MKEPLYISFYAGEEPTGGAFRESLVVYNLSNRSMAKIKKVARRLGAKSIGVFKHLRNVTLDL